MLNKINNTEFEFKRIFYSNEYLLHLWIVQFQALTITIQLWLQLHHISHLQFTSLHITHTRIYLQLHSSLNPASEQSAKIFTNAVKLKKKYFCNIKWNMIFENMICLSYLGCSSSFKFEFIIHEQLVTYTVYYCICHKAMHVDIYTWLIYRDRRAQVKPKWKTGFNSRAIYSKSRD